MSKSSIVDVLIENIQTDQNLLQEVEVKIDNAKDEKQEIVNRLKEQQKDISVLLKYADEDQQAKITELGFDFNENQKTVNNIATVAFDLILKAKDHQLSNSALYEGYVKSLKNKEEAVTYSAFNIKCSSLFNTQKLLRKKGTDPKSSREDIISLNGRVLPKEDKPKPNLKADEKTGKTTQ
jgi:hypothetical protein